MGTLLFFKTTLYSRFTTKVRKWRNSHGKQWELDMQLYKPVYRVLLRNKYTYFDVINMNCRNPLSYEMDVRIDFSV